MVDVQDLQDLAGIVYHLTCNFYPLKFSEDRAFALAPVALRAQVHARAGEWNKRLDLPKGWVVNGEASMTVASILDWLCLTAD